MCKKISSIFILFLIVSYPFNGISASGLDNLQSNLGIIGTGTGLGSDQDTDLKGRIVDIVNIALGFLGIIAVIIIIYAGFKWMTAGGNEEAVSDAKGTIRNAVIGLAVVFLSFIIINFTVTQLSKTTGDNGNDQGVILNPLTCIYYDASEACPGRLCVEGVQDIRCASTRQHSRCGQLTLEESSHDPCSDVCAGCTTETP